MTRNRPLHWHAVAEAVAVTALLGRHPVGVRPRRLPRRAGDRSRGAPRPRHRPQRDPRVGADRRRHHRCRPCLRRAAPDPARPCSGWPSASVSACSPASSPARRATMAARQAPYAAAHQLMERIHRLRNARAASGLDSAALAADLDAAMRQASGCAVRRSSSVDPDDTLRPLNGSDDVAAHGGRDRAAGVRAHTGRGSGPAARLPAGAGLLRPRRCARWTPELDERALEVADEFVLRLDTAVLFDDVRALATSEERNRHRPRDARRRRTGDRRPGLHRRRDRVRQRPRADPRPGRGPARGDHPAGDRDPLLDLRPAPPRRRRPAVRRAGRLRARGQPRHRPAGPPAPGRVRSAAAHLDRHRGAARRAGGHRQRPQARPRRATSGSPSTPTGPRCSLEIDDDGVGNAVPREHHWGLQTMRERAATVGAQLAVTPRPDGGTVVSLRSPTTAPPEGDNAHGHHRATR